MVCLPLEITELKAQMEAILVAIANIPAGPAGPGVEMRINAGYIQWRQTDDNPSWTNLIAIPYTVEMRSSDGYIQYRPADGVSAWINLVPLSAITGPGPGDFAIMLADQVDSAKGSTLVGHRSNTVRNQFNLANGESTRRRWAPRPKHIRMPHRRFGTSTGVDAVTSSIQQHSASIVIQKPTVRKKITSFTRAGVSPSTFTAVCAVPHELEVDSRIRVGGLVDNANANSDTSAYGSVPVSADFQNGVVFRNWKVTEIVDDYTFKFVVQQATPGASPDTGTNIWFEPLPTFWGIDNPVFNFPFLKDKRLLNWSSAASGTYKQQLQSASRIFNTPWNARYFQTIEFMCNDLEFWLLCTRGRYRIFIDDVLQSNIFEYDQPSFPAQLMYFKLGKKARRRKVRIENCATAFLWGVITLNANAISAVPKGDERPLCLFLGDSFGEGTGAPVYYTGLGYQMCAMLNFEFAQGSLGSTGITTSGVQGAGSDFISRIKTYAARGLVPDKVIFQDSINDGTLTTAANVEELIGTIRALWPAAEMAMLGRIQGSPNPSAPTVNVSRQNAQVCEKNKVPYVDGGIGVYGSVWMQAGNYQVYYSGTAATATAVVGAGAVTSINVVTGGVGYDPMHLDPAVTITGGGGTGAVAVPVMSTKVGDVMVMSQGAYYTSATVSFTHGASATALVSGGAITSISVVDQGIGFKTPPPVVITGGGGTGATAVAVLEDGVITAVNVTNGGTGYTSAPTIDFKICDSPATGTAVISGGKITGITLTDPGTNYTDVPAVVITGTGGGGAVALAFLTSTVTGINVTNGGSGYSTTPTVTVAHPLAGDNTHPKANGHTMLAARYSYQLREFGW